MPVIGRWRDFSFEVSPETLLSFDELQIRAARETEAVSSGGQQYVKSKAHKPLELSLSVQLHGGLGYDVQEKAEALRGAARYGDSSADYFYIGARKLLPCRVSVTEAAISDIRIAPGGVWTSARAELTFQQAGLLDGTRKAAAVSNGTAGGYSGKLSVRTGSETASGETQGEVDAVSGAAPYASAGSSYADQALARVRALISTAKSGSKASVSGAKISGTTD